MLQGPVWSFLQAVGMPSCSDWDLRLYKDVLVMRVVVSQVGFGLKDLQGLETPGPHERSVFSGV